MEMHLGTAARDFAVGASEALRGASQKIHKPGLPTIRFVGSAGLLLGVAGFGYSIARMAGDIRGEYNYTQASLNSFVTAEKTRAQLSETLTKTREDLDAQFQAGEITGEDENIQLAKAQKEYIEDSAQIVIAPIKPEISPLARMEKYAPFAQVGAVGLLIAAGSSVLLIASKPQE